MQSYRFQSQHSLGVSVVVDAGFMLLTEKYQNIIDSILEYIPVR